MLDNLNIGKKMLLLSGTILCLLLATLILSINGISNIVSAGEEVANGTKLRSELLQREVDHLNWANRVNAFLTDPKITRLDVQLEHTRCGFGKWYYGEGRRAAEQLLPAIRDDLRQIEQPHSALHASAKKIKQLYFADKQQQAKQVFTHETHASLLKVQSLLKQMSATASNNILSDQEMIKDAENSRTGILTLGSVALLLGVALALLMTRSIKGPLEKTVVMIESMEKGHINRRLGLNRKDEIGQLANAMDRFADSLQHEVITPLQQLAHGDLTFDVTPHDDGDLLRTAIRQLGIDLNQTIQQIQVASEQIASGSHQVSDSAQSLSQGATESAASVEEISSSMNQIGAQTGQSAENATQANQLASGAAKAATTGSERMAKMITAMSEINQSGQSISKIIKVIDEIAFQTNLLALNAAVEAARAGQHGKGFAVVAEEVRNLAARSAKAASETAELIEGSVEKATNGMQIAEQTSESLDQIVTAITKVDDLISEIASASNEQAQGVAQINVGLQQIDQVIQQNTATAEESAATSEELSGQAAGLKNQLGHFKLKDNRAARFQLT